MAELGVFFIIMSWVELKQMPLDSLEIGNTNRIQEENPFFFSDLAFILPLMFSD